MSMILIKEVGLTFCVVMAATLKTMGDIIVGSNPLSRIGSPEDVTGTCIFLSSRAGSYVNGATIALDGGSLVSAGFTSKL